MSCEISRAGCIGVPCMTWYAFGCAVTPVSVGSASPYGDWLLGCIDWCTAAEEEDGAALALGSFKVW